MVKVREKSDAVNVVTCGRMSSTRVDVGQRAVEVGHGVGEARHQRGLRCVLDVVVVEAADGDEEDLAADAELRVGRDDLGDRLELDGELVGLVRVADRIEHLGLAPRSQRPASRRRTGR